MAKTSAFSLIELIITLLLVGIFAVMIVPFFQSGVFDSAELLQTRQELYDLNTVMSQMVVQYEGDSSNRNDEANLLAFLGSPGLRTMTLNGNNYVYWLAIANPGLAVPSRVVTISLPNENNTGPGIGSLTYLFTVKD